jgi:hypothetical protein
VLQDVLVDIVVAQRSVSMEAQPMRPKARELAQHGGPPDWLNRVTQQGVIMYVIDGRCRLPRRSDLPTCTGLGLICITKCTQNTVMSYVYQVRHGLVL